MDAPLPGSSVAEALGNAFRLNSDRHRHGQEAFTASPFSRLLVTHVLSVAGDALVTMALAGSLFFSTPLHAARGRVALTLLLTMAPFAVVAPLLGPIIDRTQGGRRLMVVATALGRAVACLLMARYINSLLLFPAAFITLVCSKGHTVAKATLVPSAVQHPQDLVEANSKLAVSGATAGFLIAVPGVAILKLAGAAWVLRVDAVVFLACAGSAFRLQVTERRVTERRVTARRVTAGEATPDETEVLVDEGEFAEPAARREVQAKPLPAGAIQVSALAMGMLRSIVGFMTFLIAFGFRHDHAPAWWYGVALACSIGGNLIGAAAAPWLRSRLREELILAGSSVTVAATGILAILFSPLDNRPAASLLAGVVGLAAGVAKLAFDALVQRHVPAASQGRSFGRFEAVFQLVWVLGALVPVVIPLSLRSGFMIVTVASGLASVMYVVGTRLARLGQLPRWWPDSRQPAVPNAGRPEVAPEGATVPLGATTPWVVAPSPPRPDEDLPWLDPQPDLGSYPPPIEAPPPLGAYRRPVPPPLAGPPPPAAPRAPRPWRDQGDGRESPEATPTDVGSPQGLPEHPDRQGPTGPPG